MEVVDGMRGCSVNAHHSRVLLLRYVCPALAQHFLRSFVHVWRFNLVDPASSHMLVSKIKPCMSQYKLLHGGIKAVIIYLMVTATWITVVILDTTSVHCKCS